MDLLKPQSVKGFATAQAPSALPDGLMSSLQNVRLGDGLVRTRWGDASIATGLTGTLRGAYECSLDGTPYLFRAAGDGSKVTVYRSTDGVAWTSITPSSGAYGDTRLTDSTTNPVRFCVVRDNPPFSMVPYDCLCIQNGTDAPRIYAQGTLLSPVFSGYGMSKVVQPDTPANVTYNSGLENYVTVSNSTKVTPQAAPVTGFTVTNSSAVVGQNWMVFSIDQNTYVGATFTVDLATPLVCPSHSILYVVSDDGSNTEEGFWAQMKVEVGDAGGNWATVYNPANPLAVVDPLIAPNTDDWWQFGAAFDPGSVSMSAITKMRFTWQGPTGLVGTQVGRMFVFGTQGFVPAGAAYAVAFSQSDARTVGPATIATNNRGTKSSNVGGAIAPTATLSTDSGFGYDYYIRSDNSTLYASGVDRMFIYRSLVGEEDYYLLDSVGMATWSGAAWALVSALGCFYEDTSNDQEDLSRPVVLDSVVMPNGVAMASANARTFVGTPYVASTSASRLYISDADAPFVFRMAADVSNPGSGTSIGFSGQAVQSIVPIGAFGAAAESLATPVSGVASVFVLTDRNLWQLSGFTVDSLSRPIGPVAPHGTLSPLSVGRSLLAFYWLDDQGQVCRFGPDGFARLSVSLVDDVTTTIPAARKVWASGACANDRYYLGYTPSGGTTNSKCLVWYANLGTWESIDTVTAGSFEALTPFYSGGYVKLLRFGTNTLYEHEQPSSTSTVSLNLTFREFGGYGHAFAATDMSVAMDTTPATPISLTTRRYFAESASNADGTISVTPTTYRIWEFDNLGAGGEGWTVQPSIFGTLPGGTRIYSATLEVKAVPQGPQRNG